jgi:hypothetical protein
MLPSTPPNDPKKPTPTRIGIWVVVGGIGAYFLLSGIIGIINGGG